MINSQIFSRRTNETMSGAKNTRKTQGGPDLTHVVVGEAHSHEVFGRTVVVHLITPGNQPSLILGIII